MTPAPEFRFRPRVYPLPELEAHDRKAIERRTARLLSALRHEPGLCVLDSAGGQPARFSLFGFRPLAEAFAPLPRDLDELRAAVQRLEPDTSAAVPGPFHGGFLGALAYDLGVHGEELELPRDPWRSPLFAGGLYTDFIVCDHERGSASLVLGAEPGDGRPPLAERHERLRGLLREADDAEPGKSARAAGPLVRHIAPEEHMARIERARELIAAGEIYQANIAHRFTRAVRGHPALFFERLRRVNPAPYMAYLAWSGADEERPAGALLSASPELLLGYPERQLEQGGKRARTRPIKGTIGRGSSPAEDAQRIAELLASKKDRAELAMIVDLERNDLGRIARPGSVRVDGFPTIETYASLHHLVADVSAEPRAGLDAIDVLAALFPGGSITGAPKLRSMEVIAELEGQGRGFFTGSLGLLDTRGHAAFNILIRTLVWRPLAPRAAGSERADGEMSFHVGGGITWRSDPASEDRETLLKGQALAAALEGTGG